MTIPELYQTAIRDGFKFEVESYGLSIRCPPFAGHSPESRRTRAILGEMKRQWSEFIAYIRGRCQ